MRRSFTALALAAAALLAPASASADLPVLGAPRLVSTFTAKIAGTSLAALAPLFAPAFQREDETTRKRRQFEVVSALPNAHSVERTFDVNVIVERVVGQQLQLAKDVRLTFISGKNLVVADLGGRTELAITPMSMGSGVLTFSSAF
jgi:hypothetical protein